MSRTISENGLALIKKWEGCQLTAYYDSTGKVWTIGYGHTGGVKEGDKISQTLADAYLKADCETAESRVNVYDDTYHWTQNQFDALVSFAYNVGNINQLTNNGTRDTSTIAEKLLLYCKSGGVYLQGLYNRRVDERNLFLTEDKTEVELEVGNTYKLLSNMNVRTGAGTNYKLVGYDNLTADGKKHDSDKNGSLDAGTKVTCKAFTTLSDNSIWMKIPSGWICAYSYSKSKWYVEEA